MENINILQESNFNYDWGKIDKYINDIYKFFLDNGTLKSNELLNQVLKSAKRECFHYKTDYIYNHYNIEEHLKSLPCDKTKVLFLNELLKRFSDDMMDPDQSKRILNKDEFLSFLQSKINYYDCRYKEKLNKYNLFPGDDDPLNIKLRCNKISKIDFCKRVKIYVDQKYIKPLAYERNAIGEDGFLKDFFIKYKDWFSENDMNFTYPLMCDSYKKV